MATSDGISTEDWDVVHALSLKVVNAEAESEENIYTQELLNYLDELERKYGVLPSILATRADYVTDMNERAAYLRQAYALAEATDDRINLREIAHSLAEFYIEDMEERSEGQIWLERFSNHIKTAGDKELHAECVRLQNLLGPIGSQ